MLTKKKSEPRRTKLTPRQRFARLRRSERAGVLDFLARLQEKFNDRIQQFVLYGSRARGEGDAESDVDVLVVVDDADWRFHDQVVLEAYEASQAHSALISALVMSRPDYEWHQAHRTPLYRNLERDGISLWTKTSEPSSSFA
jgi:predicted nucleotidyltransferase